MGNLLLGTLNQIVMRPARRRLHAAKYLAEETGGHVMPVNQRGDLAAGLESVIADVGSRYLLGFSRDDGKQDDGRIHRLDVKVEADGPRGTKRKLTVRARRGYSLPPGRVPGDS